jgi:hypothetical protein
LELSGVIALSKVVFDLCEEAPLLKDEQEEDTSYIKSSASEEDEHLLRFI